MAITFGNIVSMVKESKGSFNNDMIQFYFLKLWIRISDMNLIVITKFKKPLFRLDQLPDKAPPGEKGQQKFHNHYEHLYLQKNINFEILFKSSIRLPGFSTESEMRFFAMGSDENLIGNPQAKETSHGSVYRRKTVIFCDL